MRAVIFDWAGTLVDYGSKAPVVGISEVFARAGLSFTAEEVRRDMGLRKRDHLRALLQTPAARGHWRERFGREPAEADLDALERGLEERLPGLAAERAHPLPGVVRVVEGLRAAGLRVGSTTGYTGAAAKAAAEAAAGYGLRTDAVAHSGEVPAGRPAPWMCLLNAIRLQVWPPAAMVKVGDTPTDMREGRTAGMWSVGVVFGSNAMGLGAEEEAALPAPELQRRAQGVRASFAAAGAHYVIDRLERLPQVLERIDAHLAHGELP